MPRASRAILGAGRLRFSAYVHDNYSIEPYEGDAEAGKLTKSGTTVVWTQRQYDNNSRLIRKTAPEGVTRYEYDRQNRLSKIFERPETAASVVRQLD